VSDKVYRVYAVVIGDNDFEFEQLTGSADSWTELTDDAVDFEEGERLLATLDAIKAETPKD
jgi:hypothetical protein